MLNQQLHWRDALCGSNKQFKKTQCMEIKKTNFATSCDFLLQTEKQRNENLCFHLSLLPPPICSATLGERF